LRQCAQHSKLAGSNFSIRPAFDSAEDNPGLVGIAVGLASGLRTSSRTLFRPLCSAERIETLWFQLQGRCAVYKPVRRAGSRCRSWIWTRRLPRGARRNLPAAAYLALPGLEIGNGPKRSPCNTASLTRVAVLLRDGSARHDEGTRTETMQRGPRLEPTRTSSVLFTARPT